MAGKLQICDCAQSAQAHIVLYTVGMSIYFGIPFVNFHQCQLRMGGIPMGDISGRGGQSALRFARLRMEKRHNYVRKVAEVATTLFITNDKPNIAGIILAGSADFKTELSQSDMFDPVGFSRP
jgi:hypothetical protein